MKKLQTKVSAFLLALCLVSMNLLSVVGATPATSTVDKTVPSVASVQAEAQATAKYLLDEDFKSLDISNTSNFKTVSRDLILGIRSGLDCSSYIDSFVKAVEEKYAKEDGSLDITVASSYSNDILSSYAFYISILTLSGKDASVYVKKLDSLLNAATVEELSITGYETMSYNGYSWEEGVGGLNPYLLAVVYSVVDSYKTEFEHYTSINEKLINALLQPTLCKEDGFYYASYSPDNNGAVLPNYHSAYTTNTSVKSLVDKSIDTTISNYVLADGGIDGYGYAANTDSTGLGLALFAEYKKTDEAAAAYNALLKLKTPTEGSYGYNAGETEANLYATHDALHGLVTYLRVLQNRTNPFDLSDVLTKTVATSDDNTSVADEAGVLPGGTTLTKEAITSGEIYDNSLKLANASVDTAKQTVSNVAVFNFDLFDSNAVAIHQLDGKIQVTIDLPVTIAEDEALKVYRVDEDKLVACESTVADGKVTFATDHFSTYLFVTVKDVKEAPVVEAEKPVAPATGDNSYIYIMILAAMLGLSMTGVVVSSKKNM